MQRAARLIALLLLSVLLGPGHAAAEPRALSEIEADLRRLTQQIEDLKLWEEMQRIADHVPKKSRCAEYYQWAKEKHEELKALNKQHRGRANATYRRRAEVLKMENNDALREYRSCFSSLAARSAVVRDHDLSRYADFKQRYNSLEAQYSKGPVGDRVHNLYAEILSMRREIHAAELWNDWEMPEFGARSQVLGTLTSVFREVTIGSKEAPRAARKGDLVYVGDWIGTGPRGRARILFADEYALDGAGPTVVNIGSNSLVHMEKFAARFDSDAPQREGVIALLRGAIRAFTEGFGGRAAFSVRVGTSLCGIRGTEVAIARDASDDGFSYYVHHGDAFTVDSRGRNESLAPGQVARFRGGKRVSIRALSPQEYAQLVMDTAPSTTMSPRTALAQAQRNFGKGSLTVKRQRATGAGEIGSTFNPAGARSRMRGSAIPALAAFERLQNAAANNDVDAMERQMSGDLRQQLEDAIGRLGRKGFRKAGWRPVSWVVDCVTCESKRSCYVYSRSTVRDLKSGKRSEKTEAHRMERTSGYWTASKLYSNPGKAYETNVERCRWQ